MIGAVKELKSMIENNYSTFIKKVRAHHIINSDKAKEELEKVYEANSTIIDLHVGWMLDFETNDLNNLNYELKSDAEFEVWRALSPQAYVAGRRFNGEEI